MKHLIEIKGIKLYAFHGCLEEEGKIGGHYEIDVLLKTDFTTASLTDELSQTIDYVLVNRIVQEEMAIRSKLIEHVGARIVNRLEKTILQLNAVRVNVRKLSPPINGEVSWVGIVIDTGV